MKGLDLFKGKSVKIITELKVPVELEIKSIGEGHDSEGNLEYIVNFTNGASKKYFSLHELEIIGEEEKLDGDINTDYERFKAVNKTRSLEELAQVIESFADNDGMIQGLTKEFDANNMANLCRSLNIHLSFNTLTRNWGIRQQALMLM